MEKDRSARLIALAALLVGVIGLSIGFSAFSSTLTISSSAQVKPDKTTFDVNFSSTGVDPETDGTVVGTVTGNGVLTGEIPEGAVVPSANDATIDNSGEPTITGLKANFTEPGQTVTYSFYAHNNGKYDAFLNSVTFENVTGESTAKVCTPAKGTDESMVAAACNDISISVKVGSETYNGSVATISGHSLLISKYEPVVVTIKYDDNDHRTDGDFDIEFGDIVLVYNSVD